MAADDQFGGRYGPVKRFGAVFLIICGIVAAITAAQSTGSKAVLIVVAVVCIVAGAVLARTSFAALQKREF